MHNNPELVYRASDDPFHFIVPLKDSILVVRKSSLRRHVEYRTLVRWIFRINGVLKCDRPGKQAFRDLLNFAKQFGPLISSTLDAWLIGRLQRWLDLIWRTDSG